MTCYLYFNITTVRQTTTGFISYIYIYIYIYLCFVFFRRQRSLTSPVSRTPSRTPSLSGKKNTVWQYDWKFDKSPPKLRLFGHEKLKTRNTLISPVIRGRAGRKTFFKPDPLGFNGLFLVLLNFPFIFLCYLSIYILIRVWSSWLFVCLRPCVHSKIQGLSRPVMVVSNLDTIEFIFN